MEQLQKAEQDLETERLRLAACSHAALANTPEAATQRLTADSPCWSASYLDVCAAVDREMSERARAERAEQQRDTALKHVLQKMQDLSQEQPDGRYLSGNESWNTLLAWLRATDGAELRRVPTRGQRQAALEVAIAAGKDMANAEQTSHPSAATKNAQRMADFARRVLELDDHAQE